MNWAQRLRRVFRIPQDTLSRCFAPIHLVDVETCPKCGGSVNIMSKALTPLAGQALASIEDDAIIEKILAPINAQHLQPAATLRSPSCAPPQREIGDDGL